MNRYVVVGMHRCEADVPAYHPVLWAGSKDSLVEAMRAGYVAWGGRGVVFWVGPYAFEAEMFDEAGRDESGKWTRVLREPQVLTVHEWFQGAE